MLRKNEFIQKCFFFEEREEKKIKMLIIHDDELKHDEVDEK